jgi:hypothetical protein
VNRTGDDPQAGFWQLLVRDSLPIISIPLRPGDVEPTLDLQAMIHQIYDAAGYHLFVYDSDSEPPLPAADAVWAAQILHPPGL